MDFKDWMINVNHVLIDTIGAGAYDLSDYPYYDAWEDGMTPEEAATDALMADGYPREELHA